MGQRLSEEERINLCLRVSEGGMSDDGVRQLFNSMEATIKSAEANLATAVDALREIKTMNCLQDDWKHIAISYWKIARDALEEIETDDQEN